jgi:hypothetical protein
MTSSKIAVGALLLATLLPTVARAQDKPAPPANPLSDRISLAIERQFEKEKAKREGQGAIERRVKGATGAILDGRFIGAIALNDLANAGIDHDKDAVDDLGYALSTPEFYAGIGLFNGTYKVADKVVNGAASKLIPARVAAAEGGLKGLAAKGTGFLKHNLILATAMTLPRVFELDFGGFNLKSAGKGLLSGVGGVFTGKGLSGFKNLGDEVKKLGGTRLHIRPDIAWKDLGITLGSFAAAGVVWEGVKTVGKIALKKLATRFLISAPLQAAALTVPVGGEIFDAVVNVGLIAWTVVDLAGLLFTANKIEEKVQHESDQRTFEKAAAEARDRFLAVTRENGGHPDPEKLDKAMADVARTMADLRDFHYLPVAIEDAKFVDRLKREGVKQSEIDALGAQVMEQTGSWLAAPGQTAALVDAYKPGNGEVGELSARHAENVRKELAELAKGEKVRTDQLDPASKDFAWSKNRDQLYDQEIAILARGAANLQDADLASRVLGDAEIVGALAEADQGIQKVAVDPKSKGLASVLGGN